MFCRDLCATFACPLVICARFACKFPYQVASFEQVIAVMRATHVLFDRCGSYLPHSRLALAELCRRLLRKEPMRAMLLAQRALLAQISRMMLKNVRQAFMDHRKKLQAEEAERAQQALLLEL